MKNQLNYAVILILSLIIVAMRVFPHEANFTPVLAICLFAGFLSKNHWVAILAPLLAMGVSDWMIGFYPGWALNYACFSFLIFLGLKMGSKMSSFLGFGLLGSLSFFAVSNFGVWAFTGLYPKSGSGLIEAFTLGIPFFRSSLAATLFFMFLFQLLNRYVLQISSEVAVKRAL